MQCVVANTEPSIAHITEDADTKTYWEDFCQRRNIIENATLLRYTGRKTSKTPVIPDVTYQDLVVARNFQKPKTRPWHVLTAIAKVTTRDGYSLWQERDSGDWPHSIELPGGFIREYHLENEALEIDKFIVERVAKDLGLSPALFNEVIFDSLFINDKIMEAMCLYTMNINLMKKEIISSGSRKFYFLPPNQDPNQEQFSTTIPIHTPSLSAFQNFTKM